SGAVSQLVYQGQEVITGDLLPNFVRPATENDRRGWKPDRKLKYWYGDTKLTDMSLRREGAEVHIESAYTLSGDSAQVVVRYTVKPQGIVSVSYDLQVKPGLPNIPKVGLQMGIHPSFESIAYYGLGEMESYPDRAYGFDLGVYRMDIDAFMEPYLVPQENGNRMDVRWFRLQNKNKRGLLVVG